MDVAGVGAVNTDLIAPRPAVLPQVEPGAEHLVDAAAIESTVDKDATTARLGGSALVAIATAAATGARTGFVGVAGRVPLAGWTVAAELDRLGVDRRLLHESGELGGTCLALVHGEERTLLVCPGANDLMAGRLAADPDTYAAYLAAARVVHVSSFLDQDTPGQLVAVLRAARERAPGLLISLDPGHVWCTAPTPAVRELRALADVVLLNEREHRAAPDGGRTVVVKHRSGVHWYGHRTGSVRHEPVPAGEIVDPTGAGDVFAGGLLAALARDPEAFEDGARLGLALVRRKLRGLSPSA